MITSSILLASITDTLKDWIDPEHLIEAFGTLGIFAIIFAESGLLIGFFLPGDSLLFTAGLLASQDKFGLSLPVLLVGCFVAAVAGDQVGYAFGKRVGPALFQRPQSRLFHPEHLKKAQSYFDKNGPKTIMLARFIPIVRTFAPIVAGMGSMPYRTFVAYNIAGGFVWSVGVTSAGYVLGKKVPDIDKYLLPIILLIVIVSILPAVLEVIKHRRAESPT